MKHLIIIIFALMMFSNPTFGQVKEITEYDPVTAIHPFRIAGLVIAPPVAILDIFFKGFYYVLDSDPIRRAFNVDVRQTFIVIDQDY